MSKGSPGLCSRPNSSGIENSRTSRSIPMAARFDLSIWPWREQAGPACSRHGQILRSNLAAIGIDLEVREFSIPELFGRLQRPGEPFDIGYSNWFFDYGDPSSYINVQFGA